MITPEHDNDRLEQFFKKAASKHDVAFNEEDWAKLEARLDAEDAAAPPPPAKPGSRFVFIGATVAVLFIAGLSWLTSRYEVALITKNRALPETEVSAQQTNPEDMRGVVPGSRGEGRVSGDQTPEEVSEASEGKAFTPSGPSLQRGAGLETGDHAAEDNLLPLHKAAEVTAARGALKRSDDVLPPGDPEPQARLASTPVALKGNAANVKRMSEHRLFEDLIQIPVPEEPRYKQRAMVNLPGAEEAKTSAVAPVAQHAARPRLSLLLFFAPDFNSTTISRYSDPGKSYGALLRYHFASRWSVSAGVVSNNKQYTGDGEDYTPPPNYWKYYTNGKIPNSIDGSCNVLEFPLSIQFTARETGRSRFILGAGTSSYLLTDESYRYHFSEPNPGAREGWASRSSSRAVFNMVNFTVGYECQVAPRLMLGIEPYLKIPIEDIGWANLRLFSTGAALTMRYVILRKKAAPIASPARSPD